MALTDKLTAIANAIRAKTGGTATMTLAEMPTEIASIQTGITPSGNINITDTNVTDVTNYATATVVSENLTPENIKKDVNILGVIGSFEGGGSLPSVISKIDGGSFTLADDTGVRSYSWAHNLGVIPRIVTVWCDELTAVTPYSVDVVTDIQATIYDTEYALDNNKSALINVIYRKANGAITYNLSPINAGQLAGWITASTIKLNPAQYFKAGATYKWAAYA